MNKINDQIKFCAGEKLMIHDLKTDSQTFIDVVTGTKKFEIRKNDRGFSVGDKLHLRETKYTGAKMAEGKPLIYSGDTAIVIVTHILEGPIYGLMDGWVIMSIDKFNGSKKKNYKGRRMGIEMMNIVFHINAMPLTETRPPYQIMKDLGIKYTGFEGQPIADRCIFYNIDDTTLPTRLPEYMELITGRW